MHSFILDFCEKHPLIHYILCVLCTMEAEWELISNSESKDFLDICRMKCLCPDEEWEDFEKKKYPIEEVIPQDTLYCEDCPFRSYSKLADFLFGQGYYCLFIRRGDFSFSQATDLLWDGCKCCGQGEDVWNDINGL